MTDLPGSGYYDLRVESRFKNPILHRMLMEVFGPAYHRSACPNLKRASEITGISHGLLGRLLSLHESPFTTARSEKRTGRVYRLVATRLADCMGVSPEELFPPSLYALELPDVAVREFQSTQVLSLEQARGDVLRQLTTGEESSPARDAEGGLREKELSQVLATLSPREERIIRLRFGIGGSERTLEDIAMEMGVTRERIRQIESKALRKLRHPSRSHRLYPLCEFTQRKENRRLALGQKIERLWREGVIVTGGSE